MADLLDDEQIAELKDAFVLFDLLLFIFLFFSFIYSNYIYMALISFDLDMDGQITTSDYV